MTETECGEQLGNRFLSLPELVTSGENRRDRRSDLAQLCGVLFYAITGIRPTALVDGSLLKPHTRPSSRVALALLNPDLLGRLDKVFEMGFELSPDRRIQSAASFRTMLEEGLSDRRNSDFVSKMHAIRAAVRTSPEYSDHNLYSDLLNRAEGVIEEACKEIIAELGEDWRSIDSGNRDLPNLRLRKLHGLMNSRYPDRNIDVWFNVVIGPTEILIGASRRPMSASFGGVPLEGPKDWDIIRERIKGFYVDQLSREYVNLAFSFPPVITSTTDFELTTGEFRDAVLKLPSRAVVALAVRMALRLYPGFDPPRDLATRYGYIATVEAVIHAAEQYAAGIASATVGPFASEIWTVITAGNERVKVTHLGAK